MVYAYNKNKNKLYTFLVMLVFFLSYTGLLKDLNNNKKCLCKIYIL